MSRLPEPSSGTWVAFLRHDVDLHITDIDRIARIEHDLGTSSTYYVPLTQPFNPASSPNTRVLRSLLNLGHEIGLHYDLEHYPTGIADAEARLDREVAYLEHLVDSPVRTICAHQPYKGHPDPFKDSERFVNPHAEAFAATITYVSDSCRAWRDATLLKCFSPQPPARLVLNTHPELWLGRPDIVRDHFLSETVVPNALREQEEFFQKVVAPAWRDHPGPLSHDAREP